MATIRPAGITGFTRSGSSNGESWPPTFVLIRTRVREREELVQVVGRNTLTSIDDSTSGFKSDAEKVGLFLFQSFILSHALRKNCDLEHFSNNVGYIVFFSHFQVPFSSVQEAASPAVRFEKRLGGYIVSMGSRISGPERSG